MGGGTNTTNKSENKIAGLFAQKFFSKKPDPAVEKAKEAAAEQERLRQLELQKELAQQALETAPNQEDVDLDKEVPHDFEQADEISNEDEAK